MNVTINICRIPEKRDEEVIKLLKRTPPIKILETLEGLPESKIIPLLLDNRVEDNKELLDYYICRICTEYYNLLYDNIPQYLLPIIRLNRTNELRDNILVVNDNHIIIKSIYPIDEMCYYIPELDKIVSFIDGGQEGDMRIFHIKMENLTM